MERDEIIVGVAMEGACLTVEQLATACGVGADWVLRYVHEGLLVQADGAESEWRFTTATLRRARRIRRIEHDFDAVPELAALFADLLEEMDALKARVPS
jgi:chaperone modulatory protein CbpM